MAPSILAADFAHLANQIAMVEAAGADWIHLDVMDGHFVPNISFGAMIVEVVNSLTNLPLDTHLMISNPEKYLGVFKKKGANLLTLHAEVPGVIPAGLQQVRDLGLLVGISINPETPVEILDPAYDLVDLILIMSVHPGFGGQKFIPEVLDKMSRVKDKIAAAGRPILIEIDGGIGLENAALVRASGAQVLVAGSSIFRASDPAEALQAIRRAADAAMLPPDKHA